MAVHHQGKNLARSLLKSQDIPIEATVKGTIPNWISGALYRNGPGRFRFGNNVYKHYFDGMGCINKFQIDNGKVYYTNKLIESKVYKRATESTTLPAMLGTPDLCSTLFSRFKAFYKPKLFDGNDNVNVNVVPFGNNQLYALTETNMIVRLDPKDLSVVNTKNIKSYLKTTNSSIAHPHVNNDGSWISVGMQLRGKTAYNFIKFDANKNCDHLCENSSLLASVPATHENGISYFHSFGLTKNYIIFLEQALVLDFKKMLKSMVFNKGYINAMEMRRDFETRIHLINRHTGQVYPQKLTTKPLFTFHHVNAYETEDNHIIADISAYDANKFNITDFNYNEDVAEQINEIFTSSKAYAKRLNIPLSNINDNTSQYVELKDINNKLTLELPTINYGKYNTKFYNYTYGIGSALPPYSLVKINVQNINEGIEAAILSDNDYIAPSEPVFIESPNAQSEDDGVLLSLVLGNKYDFLMVLDAKNMTEIGRATLPESVKATFSFHGFFADNETYKNFNLNKI